MPAENFSFEATTEALPLPAEKFVRPGLGRTGIFCFGLTKCEQINEKTSAKIHVILELFSTKLRLIKI